MAAHPRAQRAYSQVPLFRGRLARTVCAECGACCQRSVEDDQEAWNCQPALAGLVIGFGLGNGVKFDLSADEYSNAVRSALDLIGAHAGSSRARAMELVLASVWNTVAYANTIDCLLTMDRPTQDLALCLIIGRAYYGPPSDLIASTAELLVGVRTTHESALHPGRPDLSNGYAYSICQRPSNPQAPSGARQICDGYAREVREWDIGADF